MATAAKVMVCAHERRKPSKPVVYLETHRRLRQEVAVEQAVREWAEAFPDECLSDPMFRATAGLAH